MIINDINKIIAYLLRSKNTTLLMNSPKYLELESYHTSVLSRTPRLFVVFFLGVTPL